MFIHKISSNPIAQTRSNPIKPDRQRIFSYTFLLSGSVFWALFDTKLKKSNLFSNCHDVNDVHVFMGRNTCQIESTILLS